jgi:alkaline phosphatase D
MSRRPHSEDSARKTTDAERDDTRRDFLARSTLAAGTLMVGGTRLAAGDDSAAKTASRQATGTRVGEVTENSAIVWTRLTAPAGRNDDGLVVEGRAATAPNNVAVSELEGACDGAPGRVRLRYGTRPDLDEAIVTQWVDVSAETDFVHQFPLTKLAADTTYHYASETAGPEGTPAHAPLKGQFRTAPAATTPGDLVFAVMTCQGYPDRGHPDGHPIYPAMQALQPRFTCMTGDLVYYDNDSPRAVTPRLARYHWERMFSLPRLRSFLASTGTYWLKDDHDTLNNDSWPGQKMGQFTFDEGQQIFRQQAPMGDGPSYRTFRWGRDLQVWMTDGRDFRSPNNTPDGPEKSIWGKEQKAWFKQTVAESTATWKILVTPTPLVGPDRKNKRDNHANEGFQHEGDELRAWLQANVPDNFFSICGDRHWQFHSVHPEAGVHEFSVGAASNQHAGGTPGLDETYHQFHRVKGGFLSVVLEPTTVGSRIRLRHHDVDGEVVYEYERERAV